MYKLLLVLLLCTPVYGEITASSRQVKALTQLTTPDIISTNLVLVGDDSVLSFTPLAVISVHTTGTDVKVKAQARLFENITLRRNPKNDTEWFLTGNGTFQVTASSHTVGVGIEEDSIEVNLGPPVPPTPPVPPAPLPSPVPPDAFGNVGQQVAKTAATLSMKAEVAAIYRKGANTLRSVSSSTPNSVSEQVYNERTALLGLQSATYAEFATIVNKEMNAHWPMSRVTFADFLSCVANGLFPATCINGVCK